MGIDILILSFSSEVCSVCSDYCLPYYEQAENLVEAGLVKNIGLADVDTNLRCCLESLYDKTKIKPSVCQVNIGDKDALCGNQDLIAFSQQYDVLLLTHTDITPFITSQKLNETLGSSEPVIKNISSAIKYSIEAKRRAVLLAKGYFIFSEI